MPSPVSVKQAATAARMQLQSEFNFQAGGADAGYAQWVALRQVAAADAARKLNLPVGRQAEVWVRGGIRLRGKLQLRVEALFIEETQFRNLAMEIGAVPFTYAEIESCVALD